jgi:hypothetical protein
MTPCSLVGDINVSEKRTASIFYTTAVRSSEQSIRTNKTIRCQNPDDHNMILHPYENLKSHIRIIFSQF